MLLSQLAGQRRVPGAGLLQELALGRSYRTNIKTRGFVEVHFLVPHAICMSVHAMCKLTMTTLKINDDENGPKTGPESDEIVGNRPNVNLN